MALPAVALKAKNALGKAKNKAKAYGKAKVLKNTQSDGEKAVGTLGKVTLAVILFPIIAILFLLLLGIFILISVAYPLLVAAGLFPNNGSGTSSSVAAGEYLQWAINIANDDSHGYSQCARSGPDYDCSSLVWYSLKETGFDENILGSYPFSTFTEANILKQLGFKEYTYTGHDDLQPGDILLRYNHTGIYSGNDMVVEASSNENGTICGGQTGDQTGKEIHNDVNMGNWDTYYRLE